eukprot:2541514-Rhodomonas_salina.1
MDCTAFRRPRQAGRRRSWQVPRDSSKGEGASIPSAPQVSELSDIEAGLEHQPRNPSSCVLRTACAQSTQGTRIHLAPSPCQ